MKIHLQKILHMKLNCFAIFAKFRFAKFGLEGGVFCDSTFKFRRRKHLTCFCRSMCDWYDSYVYVMHVCNFHDLRVVSNAIRQEPNVLPTCVMACVPFCDDPIRKL